MSKYDFMWNEHLGRISVIKYRIELMNPDSRSIHFSPYRVGHHQHQLERDKVTEMSSNEFAEGATIEWASPVVFIPKKDGSLRFCRDYRRFSAMTVCDRYPIPKMDKYFDSLGNAAIFSTLDSNSSGWQIEMNENT